MIVEVRSYRIKPGRREEVRDASHPRSSFTWNEGSWPTNRSREPKQARLVAQFPLTRRTRSHEDPFYEGEFWKNELEAIAMPMIDSYDVILCETSGGYVCDGPFEGE